MTDPIIQKFREKFDWKACEKFVPTDGVVRDCYKCGFQTEFCDNCKRDHHTEDRDKAIEAYFSATITEAREEGRKENLKGSRNRLLYEAAQKEAIQEDRKLLKEKIEGLRKDLSPTHDCSAPNVICNVQNCRWNTALNSVLNLIENKQ